MVLHSINNILQAIQLDQHESHALIAPMFIGDIILLTQKFVKCCIRKRTPYFELYFLIIIE